MSDLPTAPHAFRRCQNEVIAGFTSALGLEDWVVRDPLPGRKSPLADKFEDRIVKQLKLDSGVVVEAHVVSLVATGDQIPVGAGLDSKDRRPGFVCCPRHSNNALRGLVFDRDSYQRAIAVRLAEAGFVIVAV